MTSVCNCPVRRYAIMIAPATIPAPKYVATIIARITAASPKRIQWAWKPNTAAAPITTKHRADAHNNS